MIHRTERTRADTPDSRILEDFGADGGDMERVLSGIGGFWRGFEGIRGNVADLMPFGHRLAESGV